uniref:Uncharacterized protein n=1 Tax=Acrobeloides nanus TaxID=290746 RepID=A0A914DYR7_9BILA
MRTSLAQRRFLRRFLYSASLAMFSIGLRSCLFQGVFVVVGIQCLVAFEYADLLIRNSRASDKDKDTVACRELHEEYRNECSRRPDLKQSNEFCVAFENVCFQIHESDPDQPVGITRQIETTERPVVASTKRDYSQFCQEYKQRFLYVCPDPFRFGQRAAVFCPVYSERCNVPIPEKPVTPTDRPTVIGIQQSTQRICAQYRNFAVGYCNNPFALVQPNVAKGCEKYRRFCTTRQQG